MQRSNRKGRFKIVSEYNGVVDKELTIEIPSMSAVRRTYRELMKLGWKFENLALLDCESGRLLSFVL
jgi:hypothetical protein